MGTFFWLTTYLDKGIVYVPFAQFLFDACILFLRNGAMFNDLRGFTKVVECLNIIIMECLKDKSGVHKIIVKKQPCQLLNTSHGFFPSFRDSDFHLISNVDGTISTHLAASFRST